MNLRSTQICSTNELSGIHRVVVGSKEAKLMGESCFILEQELSSKYQNKSRIRRGETPGSPPPVLSSVYYWISFSMELIEAPRYEDYEIKYRGLNRWQWLGNGFSVRDYDGRDLTWYMGLVEGEEKQREFDLPDYSLW